MKKSPLIAFFLALIPGFGHVYLNKKVRGFLYAIGFFGSIALGILLAISTYDDAPMLVMLILAFIIWGINMLDIVITLIRRGNNHQQVQNDQENGEVPDTPEQNERFFTIILSFIPGVGHFHLGLNQRGVTFLAGFIGLGAMIFFVALISHQEGFLVFLLALPVIWIYSFFDAIQLLNQKQKGEELIDRTIMEDLDHYRESGKKSKMLATLLAIFPGAGHLYLGLQKRGIQLMVAFLLSIYILDTLRLSLFLFLIPVIWFFSFFDALQNLNRFEEEELEDIPVIKYFVNHQKWVGIALIILGIYYLLDSVFLPAFADELEKILNINIWYYYHRYLQITIVCLIFIGGGIKLLLGSKSKKGDQA